MSERRGSERRGSERERSMRELQWTCTITETVIQLLIDMYSYTRVYMVIVIYY